MAMGNNIRFLRLARGLSHDALGELAGTSGQTIVQLEKRDSKKSSYAAAIARAFNLSVEELQETDVAGLDAAKRLLEQADSRALNPFSYSPIPPQVPLSVQEPQPEYIGRRPPTRLLPVVGTARLGENGYYEQLAYPAGHGDGYVEHSSSDPDAYVLQVRGDSMAPAIRNRWYVAVEPNSAITPGEYVAVQLKDGRKMVKELLLRDKDGGVELMSVNGGMRLSFHRDQIECIQAIGAVIPPSKHREH